MMDPTTELIQWDYIDRSQNTNKGDAQMQYSNKELLIIVATLVTTIAEVDYAPQDPMYMAFLHEYPSMTSQDFIAILGIMERCGQITRTSDTATITPAGRELAERINASLNSGKKGA